MKKVFTLFLLIFCLIPFISGCGNENENPEQPSIIEPGGNENNKEEEKENNKEENKDNNNNNNNNNNNSQIEIKNGTEVAKILLAQDRLDESVLEKSGTLFTDGKKAMARIIDRTKQYLKRNTGRPNETYTEVDGDTYKWFNDVDYSNFMSFFESYAVNIESSAESSARLIDYTKKYIRVVNKWVKQYNNEYYLAVDENSEIIINRQGNYFINVCKRYTDENGNSVYEMLQKSDNVVTRMKYIPNLLYEFSMKHLEVLDSAQYLYADNSKGYWTILSSGPVRSYIDYQNQERENYNAEIVVVKDEANYKMSYLIDEEGRSEINVIDIISSDSKTDLLSMSQDSIVLYNTGIKGLDHIEITAPKDKVGAYDPDSEEILYVYEQNNIDSEGNPYKIYSTSGHKSATAVLENGLTLTDGDKLLDGKVEVRRIDVSYVAECDSYGMIPLVTNSKSYEEQFHILEELLDLTGITFRRDYNDVINGIKYALKDVKSFSDYFTWNGYHLNDLTSVKEAINIEESKTEKLLAIYNEIKDTEVIDFEDQEKYNANIHFSDIEITNPGTITNEGFTISINNFSIKVKDTLLFVDKEMYKVVFALLNKEGNLISFLHEEDLTTQYIKGNEFETTQTKNIELGILEQGEYTLVAYVALASEGIRITKYQKVNAQIIEFSRNEQGFKNTIQSNENKELIIISEIDHNLYYEFEGDLPYDKLVEFMGQAAYDHGMIDELIIEMFDGENWVVVEPPKVEETNPEDETIIPNEGDISSEMQEEESSVDQEINEEQNTEENIQMLEKGQYRMKYIVAEEEQEAYVYVTIK